MFAHIPQTTEVPCSVAPAESSAMRVLLLDDSEFDRRRVKRLLQNVTFKVEVDEAASTRELQRLLDTYKYDVALLDYRLPVGDGGDAIALVRHHPTNADCPAIMIAGDAALDLGGQVMHDKCDGFLPKAHLSAEALSALLIAMWQKADGNGRALEPVDAFENEAIDQSRFERAETNGLLDAALFDLEHIIRDVHNLRYLPRNAPVEMAAHLAQIEQRAILQWRALRTALASSGTDMRLLDLAPHANDNRH